MDLTLIRHATLLVEIAGQRLLVDPMLDPARERPAVAETPNQRRNPLIDLPTGVDQLVSNLDAVLLTHPHEDHLDQTAVSRLSGGVPVLCQPTDVEYLEESGFADVRPVDEEVSLGGLAVARTDGRHGSGEIGESMGPVSGFVLTAAGEPTVYIAGDTIWCPEARDALDAHAPDVVVVNAGAARLLEGDPITMTTPDVVATAERAPRAQLFAVHMDAINHCLLTRAELREELTRSPAGERVTVPEDGGRLTA